MTIVTIGLDLAKSVFQAHGVDEKGATALTKRLHRKQMAPFFSKLPRCLIAMEACGTAHYWARTLADGARGPPHSALLREGLRQARQERCVRRPGDLRSGAAPGDAVRARKDCRAAEHSHGSSREVPARSPAHHAGQCFASASGGVGLVANPGIANLAKLAQQALSDENGLPSYARTTLEALVRQIMTLSEEITALDRKLLAWHAENEVSQRLTAIPGLGIVTATAIAATVTDPAQFRSADNLPPGLA